MFMNGRLKWLFSNLPIDSRQLQLKILAGFLEVINKIIPKFTWKCKKYIEKL